MTATCSLCQKVLKSQQGLKRHLGNSKEMEHRIQYIVLNYPNITRQEALNEIAWIDRCPDGRMCSWCGSATFNTPCTPCKCKKEDAPQPFEIMDDHHIGTIDVYQTTLSIYLQGNVVPLAKSSLSKIHHINSNGELRYHIPFDSNQIRSRSGWGGRSVALDTLSRIIRSDPKAQMDLWVLSGLWECDEFVDECFDYYMNSFGDHGPWASNAKYVYPGNDDLITKCQRASFEKDYKHNSYLAQIFIPELLRDAKTYFQDHIFLVRPEDLDGLADNVVIKDLAPILAASSEKSMVY